MLIQCYFCNFVISARIMTLLNTEPPYLALSHFHHLPGKRLHSPEEGGRPLTQFPLLLSCHLGDRCCLCSFLRYWERGEDSKTDLTLTTSPVIFRLHDLLVSKGKVQTPCAPMELSEWKRTADYHECRQRTASRHCPGFGIKISCANDVTTYHVIVGIMQWALEQVHEWAHFGCS